MSTSSHSYQSLILLRHRLVQPSPHLGLKSMAEVRCSSVSDGRRGEMIPDEIPVAASRYGLEWLTMQQPLSPAPLYSSQALALPPHQWRTELSCWLAASWPSLAASCFARLRSGVNTPPSSAQYCVNSPHILSIPECTYRHKKVKIPNRRPQAAEG